MCLIETDKITNEVDAEYDSVLRKLIAPAGGEAEPVGALLAVVADADVSDADVEAFAANFKAANTSVAARKTETPEPAAPVKIETNRPISPDALKLAERLGVDLARIEGSGRGERRMLHDRGKFAGERRPDAPPQSHARRDQRVSRQAMAAAN